jgi:hypothetical protein
VAAVPSGLSLTPLRIIIIKKRPITEIMEMVEHAKKKAI